MMKHDDYHLMRRLGRDDEQAMGALLERHWRPLVRYAFRFLGSWDQAEDVVQDAFARLWANRARWSTRAPGPLLYRITRNGALDDLKAKRHSAPREDPRTLVAEDRSDRDAELGELEDAVARAVEHLPPRRREVFTLAREGGFSYAEIAEIMGTTERTVANQMSLALSDLRVVLRPYLQAEPTREAPRGDDALAGSEG